ncbi:MAG: class I SAM-dependent methyltransferase [Mariprofundaceae bacterium]|nr:class I SAM-dependent methyltransferase [Mariprofundaceae bacterium]
MDKQQLKYCAEVLRFRKVLNLTSIRDEHVFYKRFIEPSIALSEWIPQGAQVLDIGSGMGVPGIPLLIHRSDITAILVERRKKRTEFIRHVVRKLALKSEVYDADIFDLPPLEATVCVARAVSDVKTLLQMCNQHIVVGGLAVLPVPDDVFLPDITGWKLVQKDVDNPLQRVVCYEKKEG